MDTLVKKFEYCSGTELIKAIEDKISYLRSIRILGPIDIIVSCTGTEDKIV